MGGESVDDGSAGIAKAEELGNFVIGFTSGVVAGAAEEFVAIFGLHGEEVGVAARGDESDGGKFDFVAFKTCFHDDGVDVAFEVVNGDQGERVGEGESLIAAELSSVGASTAPP